MNQTSPVGREAILQRDVPLLGGMIPAGTRVRVAAELEADCVNVEVIDSPRAICRLPKCDLQIIPLRKRKQPAA
ncbi:MAG: hypothetical protein ACK5Q5_08885 [Planctomycetaceae bacterium]